MPVLSNIGVYLHEGYNTLIEQPLILQIYLLIIISANVPSELEQPLNKWLGIFNREVCSLFANRSLPQKL